jgi:hypothetical protein
MERIGGEGGARQRAPDGGDDGDEGVRGARDGAGFGGATASDDEMESRGVASSRTIRRRRVG